MPPERSSSLPPSTLSGPLGVAISPTASPLTRELVELAISAATEIGWEAKLVRPGEDQAGLGVLLGIGYEGNFMPVFAGPRRCPRVAWVGEPLIMDGSGSASVLTRIARSRAMDYLKLGFGPFKDVPLPGKLSGIRADATTQRERARHLRIIADVVGRGDRLVVTSRDRQDELRSRGLTAAAVPFGYAPAVAGQIAPPDVGRRDLALVTLASQHARKAARRAVIDRWQEMEPRLLAIEGAWGEQRNIILRRSKVVLNVARVPGEFVGVRLVLAIAAGAVVVTEPMNDPYPFVAGEHFVEAPLDCVLEAARELEADEPRRRRISLAGQTLLVGELSAARCLRRALDVST